MLFGGWYGAWHCHAAPLFAHLLDFSAKTCEDAAVNVTRLSSIISLEARCAVALCGLLQVGLG
jgi:hypothetical protein